MTRLVMAPMRGITDALYRNAFQRHFDGLDGAVAPFIVSVQGPVRRRLLQDVWPERNAGLALVPQILSNHAADFLRLAEALQDLGYSEINWNLGCPFRMVARKGRGSGLLPDPRRISAFLEHVVPRLPGRLSVKTRLGRSRADEIEALIPVFNAHPLAAVIIHPRTGLQMYTGAVDEARFADCLAALDHPVLYNGDIWDLARFERLAARFPGVSGWMLGRGLIRNPFLAEMLRAGLERIHDPLDRLKAFHDDLLNSYAEAFNGPGHLVARMKGLWGYWAGPFGDEGRRLLKQVRKQRHMDRYREVVEAFFARRPAWRPALAEGPPGEHRTSNIEGGGRFAPGVSNDTDKERVKRDRCP